MGDAAAETGDGGDLKSMSPTRPPEVPLEPTMMVMPAEVPVLLEVSVRLLVEARR